MGWSTEGGVSNASGKASSKQQQLAKLVVKLGVPRLAAWARRLVQQQLVAASNASSKARSSSS